MREVVVREIELRGKSEYIVEEGLPKDKKLDILLSAVYNSILTSSEFDKTADVAGLEEKAAINCLKDAVANYLKLHELIGKEKAKR